MVVKSRKEYIKIIRRYIIVALVTILIVAVLRIFFFASFKIPSHSMEPSLLIGDYIIVTKLIPGPRIFTSFNFDGNIKTKRLCGIRDIKRNDVIVFNFIYRDDWSKIHMNINDHYVKRCIGLPGDTLSIINGIYKLSCKNDTLGDFGNQHILSVIPDKDLKKQEGIYKTIPFDTLHNWNIKNLGPLYIPRKGDAVTISPENIGIYRNLIEYETGKKITNKEHLTFGDNTVLSTYIFKQNYYFVAGDFVLDSKDSRYWGLLPEDHIIGKAIFIWKSFDPITNKYRFDRIFKSIK